MGAVLADMVGLQVAQALGAATEELKQLAEEGRRPVTHEILWAIEKHIEERRKEKPNE